MEKKILFYKVLEKYFESLPWVENREKIYLDDIKKIEKKYNIIFPNDYKKFLLEYNGGYVNFGIFDGFLAENIYEKNQNGNIPFFYSLDEISSQIIHEEKFLLEGDEIEHKILFSMNFFPIAHSSGYEAELLIGIGEENFGKIFYFERCSGGVEIEDIHYLCESFTDFINAYILVEDNE